MKKLLIFSLSFICLGTVVAQQKKYWSSHTNTDKITTDKSASRLSFPKEFKLFDLNINPLHQELLMIADNRTTHSTVISLPNADGGVEEFEIFEASNFEPALQAMFPEIRAFSGRGITDKYATLKLSISPQGLQTMVFRTEKENEFIEPYSKDHSVYAVFKSHRSSDKLPWTCSTVDSKLMTDVNSQIAISENGIYGRSGGNVKILRLAQSVTAEYSNYFGATSASQVGLVLAAINATLTRCNGVYEKDLAVHLNLISASTKVIYYNASTDPYANASTGAGGTWNGQLQSTLTSVIGEANYDIGHLFGASGGGGNAGCIGCICTDGSKGKGFTSPADGIPQGDNFDIDYVVHEVGHQLGANHTFSMSNEGTGVNKEIGSGITIMGYAGITSYDVASHSIDIFHQASIAQIQTNLNSKTCPVTATITNSTPVVAAVSNYTIPKSTPFALTGSAMDGDAGDVLTYCWEQNDNASSSQTNASSKASATKTSGPNWISFRPTVSSTRYFPQLSTILSGGLTSGPMTGGDAGVTTEALSSVARTLNFRLTVRDNAPYSSTAPVTVAQTNYTDMVVTVSSTSGPFDVTVPNTTVSWVGGSSQAITWSVASTSASPVSCANVKISLSTDGGLTFPVVLAESTANDGAETLVIPNTPTTTARIKVEAVGNIFFDISNTNFTITAGGATCGDPTELSSSAIANTSATVNWTGVTGAVSYAVDYKLNSSSTWLSAATATTATSVNLSGLTQSSVYDWRVKASCSSATGNFVSAQFTTSTPAVCVAPTGLVATAITTTGTTVNWSAVSGAISYGVDYKLSSSSTWLSGATATTSTSIILSGLTASSTYDWRVRTNCSSLTSTYTIASFTTGTPSGCTDTYESNNTSATAAPIPLNTDITAQIASTTDKDYYSFSNTVAQSKIKVTLTNLPFDYDMKLIKPNGNTQTTSQNAGTTSETIIYNPSNTNSTNVGLYKVYVYGYNAAYSTTQCYTLKVQISSTSFTSRNATDNLSGEEITLRNGIMKVYPMPASNNITISFDGYSKTNTDIVITNQLGQEVMRKKVAINDGINFNTLDVSTLKSGIYFIRVNDGKTIQTKKVIIGK